MWSVSHQLPPDPPTPPFLTLLGRGFPQLLSLAFGCRERALSPLQSQAPTRPELSVPGEASQFNFKIQY